MAWARARGFTADRSLPELAHLDALKGRLLGIGGWAVILVDDEPDLDLLLKHGTTYGADDAAIELGSHSECHANSALGFLRDPHLGIGTGYALSRDGIWRQHSWGFNAETFQILETTEERLAYFGIRLDDVDALIFCTRNLQFGIETQALLTAKIDVVAPETRASFVSRLASEQE